MTTPWHWPGSRWWRFDLHTHSPASHDFRPPPAPEEPDPPDWPRWIEAARQAGLQAVAITDHNTTSAVEPLQAAAASPEASPVLFPGVEITANDGTHLLLVLDPECTARNVEDVLAQAGIPSGERGRPESRSSHSVEQILDLSADGRILGLFLGAHVNGPAGLLEHDGQQRIAELRHPGLAAVEVVPEKPIDESWLDGRRAEIGRSIPRVWCSDAHSLDQLGRRFTWIKMTRPNAEGLRLALLDGADSLKPTLRERPGDDPNDHASLAIERIVVNKARYQGRAKPLEVAFNPWLNAIIGGRGTGKSSLVDFCRKAFRRDGELDGCEELKKAFDSRLRVPSTRDEEGLLSPETLVEITYRRDGERFRLSWSHDGRTPAIARLVGEEQEAEEGDVRQRFPVRIYSQKQLFELARDPNALLTVIDDAEAVRGEESRRAWEEQGERYLARRAQARSLRARAENLPARRAELSDVRRKLGLLEQGGHATALNDYRLRQLQDRTWQAIREAALRAVGEVERSAAELVVADLDLGVDGLPDAPETALRRAHADLSQAVDRLKQVIEGAIQRSRDDIQRLLDGPDPARWRETLNESEARYRSITSELRAAGIANPNEYRDLMDRAAALEREIVALEEALEAAERHDAEAAAILEPYRTIRYGLSEKRRAFAQEASGEFIRIEVKAFGRDDGLDGFLRDALGIERFDNDHDSLAAAIRPPPDRPWEWTNLDAVVERLRKLLAGDEGAWEAKDQRFIPALRRLQPERLDRLALYLPEDRVTVWLRGARAADVWRPLAHGSPGQQTAALLAFVLGYGREPIILDQPEDDLDNTLVYELLVKRLREVKPARQVIVVTHNPNIVVHGDAELVVSLDSRKGQTRTVCTGGLQEQGVRDEICRVMEGGREAFETRYRRIMRSVEGAG